MNFEFNIPSIHGAKSFIQKLKESIPVPSKIAPDNSVETKIRNATLQQTSYTPKARQALSTIPIKAYGAPNTNYVNENAGGYYNPTDNTIYINSQNPADYQVQTLRHEFIHSQDNGLLNSAGFYNSLQNPQDRQYIDSQLRRGPYPVINPQIQNAEGLSYIGQDGQSVLNGGYGNYYNPLYMGRTIVPIHRNPLFPAPEFLQEIISNSPVLPRR